MAGQIGRGPPGSSVSTANWSVQALTQQKHSRTAKDHGSGRASENMSLGYIRNKRKRSSIKQLMELCKPNGDHVVEQTTGQPHAMPCSKKANKREGGPKPTRTQQREATRLHRGLKETRVDESSSSTSK
ncbi:hypothetical protein An14g03940 [Aspergillus niger]|uniref:Uncharacterized protein n=2 Tax=Aspergillus niger TaxID=5061 RepID=A2R3D8_ASPNC|nr:hypothetical protein An14g03940 [Aspergillus niger]CAK46630.1 hypothetical protein An14g03940 [Aspergillus niger]